MIIDCSECELFETEHCRDCLVTAVLSHTQGSMEIEPEEEEAIAALVEAGLAPALKFRKKAG